MIQQQQQGRPVAPTRYQIPTHLTIEDKIISYGGIGLTVRQAFLLLVGWSTAFNIWQHLGWLNDIGTLGLIARLSIALIPGLISLVVAFLKIDDRTFESWLNMMLRYWTLPKVYIWRPQTPADGDGSSPGSRSPSTRRRRRGRATA